VAQQVHLAQIEGGAHHFEFVDEGVHPPQVGVLGMVGSAASDLVVDTTVRPASAKPARSVK